MSDHHAGPTESPIRMAFGKWRAYGLTITLALVVFATACSGGREISYPEKFTTVDPAWAVTAEEGY